jgi:hypothetical protein
MKALILALILFVITATVWAGGIGMDLTCELSSTGGGAGGEPPVGGTVQFIGGASTEWIAGGYADWQ